MDLLIIILAALGYVLFMWLAALAIVWTITSWHKWR